MSLRGFISALGSEMEQASPTSCSRNLVSWTFDIHAMDEKHKFLGTQDLPPKVWRLSWRARRILAAAILCVFLSLVCVLRIHPVWKISHGKPQSSSTPQTVAEFQSCSISNFLATGLPFLTSASPLPMEEFIQRRNILATALIADGVDAFVAEPGYTFQYYANISQQDWEPWEPEERPFLMVIQPRENKTNGEVTAKTTFLAPRFEVERVKLLGMPFDEELSFVAWEEHQNPYSILRQWWEGEVLERTDDMRLCLKLMVDEEMRDFIQRGLSSHDFQVVGLGGEVERVRQTKSQREIEIIRAVNTGTVVALREMRKCMYPGLRENEVANVLDNTLRAGGLEPFFDIVLFDENASNPHGGTDGDKVLESETFVLIDVGAHLYGYSSDISRTFFPPFLPRPPYLTALSSSLQEKLKVWDIVFEAQTMSMRQMRPGNSAASVDIAARDVIIAAGFGEAFTHRLGHGIGIKAHESPYLNKGNTEVALKAGMTFTSEPGVYLVDKFGVRHEDILLVSEHGEPDVLSGKRAESPWDP